MENAWSVSSMSRLLLDFVWVHRQVHWDRTRAKQLPWSQARTHLSESCRLYRINVSTLHWFWGFLVFFFLTGRLDQSSLTGKRVQPLQLAWNYVSFKLEFRGGHIFTTLAFLSNVITCFHLMWHWCLLSSSFSLLVQFLQLRCQADKQGNNVSDVYGNSDWMKIKGKKKRVKIVPGKSMHLISRKARLSLPACLRAVPGRTARALHGFTRGTLQEGVQSSLWGCLWHSCRGDASLQHLLPSSGCFHGGARC